MNPISLLQQTRSYTAGLVETLTDEQLRAVPAGFNNSILWNLGHLVVTQQLLHYGLAGLPLYVPDETVRAFRKGTSPAHWPHPPDKEQIMEWLLALPDRFASDYDAGRFRRFKPYETSTGVVLGGIDDALLFNNFHEGLHVGSLMALRRHIAL